MKEPMASLISRAKLVVSLDKGIQCTLCTDWWPQAKSCIGPGPGPGPGPAVLPCREANS